MPRNNTKSSALQNKKFVQTDKKGTVSFSELAAQFLLFKKSQGMSDRTLADYGKTFKEFNRVTTSDIMGLQELDPKVLEYFTTKGQMAPTTYNIPYANLNCFFNWCVFKEYLPYNPLIASGLKKKKDKGSHAYIPF